METLLKGAGYSYSVDPDGDLVWMIEGYKNLLTISKDKKSIQFSAAFSDGNATLKKVNEWNKTRKYSKTYLDDDGDPVLELDLDLEGGVTTERIVDFLKTCRLSFTAWMKEVIQ
jgi:hypothetical protein